MTNKEKIHDIRNAYHLVLTVLEDTDEDLWAYEILGDAAAALKDYFEEQEI